jgi:hypothetical protein
VKAIEGAPCIIPGCSMMAIVDRYPLDTRTMCRTCWRLVPRQTRERIKQLERRRRWLDEQLERDKNIQIGKFISAWGAEQRLRYAMWNRAVKEVPGKSTAQRRAFATDVSGNILGEQRREILNRRAEVERKARERL